MSRWFRMYAEVLDDPKVQRLAGDDFKAWVNILCLAAKSDGQLPGVEDIAFALRLDRKKADALVGRLVSAGLLDPNDGGFTPHKWNDRQYKSDVSTTRVKRFRERSKKQDETKPETAPETDTEQSSVTKVTGTVVPIVDPQKRFWDMALEYLGEGRRSLIGKWLKAHGRDAVAAAIGAAQAAGVFDPVPWIEARFNTSSADANQPWVCP